jgi:uncharacterized peroxidase-related enzyme
MSRIRLIDHRNASDEQKVLLDSIQSSLGMVPNLHKVLANSPVALRAFLGLHGLASGGSLAPMTRERIALALAQQNACEYCLAAHTASGRSAGLTGNEMAANRAGTSEDARAAVAVTLARSLSEHMGGINGAELTEARDAGYTDADIVEIITHVGMNLLTNIVAKAADIDISPIEPTPKRKSIGR